MDNIGAILVQRYHTGITFYSIYLLLYSNLISSRLGFNFADTTGQDSESYLVVVDYPQEVSTPKFCKQFLFSLMHLNVGVIKTLIWPKQ